MSQPNSTNEQGDVENALGMSDEAFAEMDPSAFETMPVDEDSETTNDESGAESEDAEPEAEASSSDTEDNDEEGEEPSDEDAVEDEEDDLEDGEADSDEEEDSTSDEEGDSDSEEDDTEETDYEAMYKALMAPFKANGREIRAETPEEARRLMQMGANYNKKMSVLKPSLKTVKLLDKHGLNDESKLSHLIDLSRGDKGAIQKLLKDSGVDPMDLDTEEESNYRPNTYTVDDREVELDEVLDALQDTPTYGQTVDLISNKWDDASKQIIANNPRVLEVLNDQMATGVYERVSTEVERLRAFGHLGGVSDIEAYKMVGDQMAADGKFADMTQQTTTERKPPARRRKAKRPDTKLKQKKRAASTTRTKPASKLPDDFAPLAMSDEEFERQFDSNLM